MSWNQIPYHRWMQVILTRMTKGCVSTSHTEHGGRRDILRNRKGWVEESLRYLILGIYSILTLHHLIN
jgi:hypothetical protein